MADVVIALVAATETRQVVPRLIICSRPVARARLSHLTRSASPAGGAAAPPRVVVAAAAAVAACGAGEARRPRRRRRRWLLRPKRRFVDAGCMLHVQVVITVVHGWPCNCFPAAVPQFTWAKCMLCWTQPGKHTQHGSAPACGTLGTMPHAYCRRAHQRLAWVALGRLYQMPPQACRLGCCQRMRPALPVVLRRVRGLTSLANLAQAQLHSAASSDLIVIVVSQMQTWQGPKQRMTGLQVAT